MARIFDVIEYATEMNDEIVHRFPETGIGDFRIGSQVIVPVSLRAFSGADLAQIKRIELVRRTVPCCVIARRFALRHSQRSILL